jgi:DNA mismatch endonuclease (patch repair protein)
MTPYQFSPTPERSSIMKKIGSAETKAEILIRKRLWGMGFKGYRKNYSKLPGRPDIVFTKKKVVVFIDGGFWHGQDFEKVNEKLKSNREYWIPKIKRNMERDKTTDEILISQGYRVIRLWEKEIHKNIQACIDQIKELLG